MAATSTVVLTFLSNGKIIIEAMDRRRLPTGKFERIHTSRTILVDLDGSGARKVAGTANSVMIPPTNSAAEKLGIAAMQMSALCRQLNDEPKKDKVGEDREYEIAYLKRILDSRTGIDNWAHSDSPECIGIKATDYDRRYMFTGFFDDGESSATYVAECGIKGNMLHVEPCADSSFKPFDVELAYEEKVANGKDND